MNIIKRICTSLWNRPFKTFMLYIITFFLCIFVSCSISVCDLSNRLSTIIKQQIGAHVYLPSTHGGIVWPKESEEYVEYTVQEMDLCNKLIQLQIRNEIEYLEIYSKLASFINGNYIDEVGNNINDEFISVHYTPMIDNTVNEIDIVSGREFTIDEMKGSNKIIVDNRLKHQDGSKVQVGDILSFKYEVLKTVFNEDFTSAYSQIAHEEIFNFEVIGLYQTNQVKKSTKILSDGSNYNALYSYYVPYETLKCIGDKINKLEETIGDNEANNGDVRMISAYFKLKDPELLKTFINEIKSLLPKYQDYKIYSSLDDYYMFAAPLERLSIVGVVVFLFASIAFVILFSLETLICWFSCSNCLVNSSIRFSIF